MKITEKTRFSPFGYFSTGKIVAVTRQCGLKNTIDIRKVDADETSRNFAAAYGVNFALMSSGGNADKARGSVLMSKVSAAGKQY